MFKSLVSILYSRGVKNVVISPGSRNAPIIDAFAECGQIKKTVVIDERTAGFIALGISLSSTEPVALVCTSGSAVLNYAPALSEAYYRHIPLIAISADRPIQLVNQNDNQTISQQFVLKNIVKNSYNISAEIKSEEMAIFANRVINTAVSETLSASMGPVHINIEVSNNQLIEDNSLECDRVINVDHPIPMMPDNFFDNISELFKKKIVIIAGQYRFSEKLQYALSSVVSDNENIVVINDSLSHLRHKDFIVNIDAILTSLLYNRHEIFVPEVVISFGGTIVSNRIKTWLRSLKDIVHWHIGTETELYDTYFCLTRKIDVSPETFFELFSQKSLMKESSSKFSLNWINLNKKIELNTLNYSNKANWSDLKFFALLSSKLNKNKNIVVHYSNGTAIRYAQMFSSVDSPQMYCNRGVSGIEGSTSTAIGMAMTTTKTTLLVSGDMSASYDIGSLSLPFIPNTFKMIVIMNGGGSIFSHIKATRFRNQRDKFYNVCPKFPIAKIAEAYDFQYFECFDENSFNGDWEKFISCTDKPSIMSVYTDMQTNVDTLDEYFDKIKEL